MMDILNMRYIGPAEVVIQASDRASDREIVSSWPVRGHLRGAVEKWIETGGALTPWIDPDQERTLADVAAQRLERVRREAGGILRPTDFFAIREIEGGKQMPPAIREWRAQVRAACDQAEAEIRAAATVAEVEGVEVEWPAKP